VDYGDYGPGEGIFANRLIIINYKTGKFFENVNSHDMAKLELRVRELERLLGKVTLGNEILKKIRDLNTKEKKDDLSIVTSRDWDQLKGGVD